MTRDTVYDSNGLATQASFWQDIRYCTDYMLLTVDLVCMAVKYCLVKPRLNNLLSLYTNISDMLASIYRERCTELA